MSKVLHIKDAYFKISDKCKDDFACAITLLGMALQRNGMTLEEMNKLYENTELAEFMEDDKQECLLSCEVVNDGVDLLRVQNEVPRYTEEVRKILSRFEIKN